MQLGRTIALFGDSGAGKTTQIGEYAKKIYKDTKKKTVYFSADLGGFDSILPLVRLGVVVPVVYGPEDSPWLWIANAADGKLPDGSPLGDDIGAVAFDSGTSVAEALLSSCAKLSATGQDIGGRPAPKFTIDKADASRTMKIGSNVDSHYMVVQSFMLDVIWRSTWLSRKGIDVIWTFAVHRGEKADDTPVLGPKLAGKALTAAVPKWFKYTFRIVSVAVPDSPPRHVLYIQEQPEANGMTISFGNSRYPIDAVTQLPATIEPASLSTALDLIEAGQQEADDVLRAELGL